MSSSIGARALVKSFLVWIGFQVHLCLTCFYGVILRALGKIISEQREKTAVKAAVGAAAKFAKSMTKYLTFPVEIALANTANRTMRFCSSSYFFRFEDKMIIHSRKKFYQKVDPSMSLTLSFQSARLPAVKYEPFGKLRLRNSLF